MAAGAGPDHPWVLGRSSGGVTDRGSKNGKRGRSGAMVLVHASSHQPRGSTHSQSAHPALFLRVSLPRLRTLYLVSHFDDIQFAMSIPVGATNQPGSISQNATAADGQVPGSSASMDSPPAHIAQNNDSDDVCVFIFSVRTDSTITNRIGLMDGVEGGTDSGECKDSSGEYCHIALLVSLFT